MGDGIALRVRPGDLVASLDDVSGPPARADSPRWVEVERVVRSDFQLVALEWPGNDAAVVVLAPAGGGHCVRAVWGFSFGGLGVEISISDVAGATHGTILVAVAATATYNDPVDSTSDPSEPRRVVLAVAPNRAAVVVDTAEQEDHARLSRHHWYFEPPRPAYPGDPVVVAAGTGGSRRWRFDSRAWRLVALPR